MYIKHKTLNTVQDVESARLKNGKIVVNLGDDEFIDISDSWELFFSEGRYKGEIVPIDQLEEIS
jgi:hypothetical protein